MHLSKIIKIITAVSLLVIVLPVAADSDKNSSVKQEWKEFGKKSADALKSFGKAMGETSKKIGEDVQNALTPKYYGTWVYEGKSETTTVEIKQDKMMTVMQRAALDMRYWSGTYSATQALIVFTVEKSGTDTGYSKSEFDDEKTWRILYSFDEENGTLTLRCSHIPTDKDGHDFSEPTIFKKQK